MNERMRIAFHIGNVPITIIDTETTPYPEELGNEYLEADEDRRSEIEVEMQEYHGLVPYANGTWGPAQ